MVPRISKKAIFLQNLGLSRVTLGRLIISPGVLGKAGRVAGYLASSGGGDPVTLNGVDDENTRRLINILFSDN